MELIPLFNATFTTAAPLMVGDGPCGPRVVGAITAIDLEGERIRATLASPVAADWMVRTGSIAVVDVRLTLRTHDDALIYMTYGGRFDLGVQGDKYAYVAPTFETGDARYAWLNAVQAVGKGRFVPTSDGGRLEYEFCEVR